jgi:hypothetical protein
MSGSRRLGAALVAIAAPVTLFVACSEPAPESRPVSTCSLPPEIDVPDSIPSDFPWADEVGITQAQLTKKFVSITGFGEPTVEELYEAMGAELADKGFDIINTDFEGFEAELYFAKGNSLAGIAAIREAPCDGYVKMNVVYDPLETAAGREAVRKTRRLTGNGATPSPTP